VAMLYFQSQQVSNNQSVKFEKLFRIRLTPFQASIACSTV
jgi:hypothetical protein